MDVLDVLIIDEPESQHAELVENSLRARGAATRRLNCTSFHSIELRITPGSWVARSQDDEWEVGATSTIWLRRLGSPSVVGFDAEEAQLLRDEVPHVLVGGLQGTAARWVDSPAEVEQAEHKLFQLAAAQRLGLRTPMSLATNDRNAAGAFAEQRRLIAKPLSPGQGIAPFVEEIGEQDLDLVAPLPVLLQGLEVDATADLRVVAVGEAAWIWSRDREAGTVDWRAVDPHGAGFARYDDPKIARDAVDLTRSLGLSMSVQDWLMTPSGAVFLEANPQGAWAFLDGADVVVADALAAHLHPARDGVVDDGRWPRPLSRIGWDLRRAEKAPANDGVEPPVVAPAGWVALAARHPDALPVAQRANDEAKASAKAAEDKSSRLAQTALAAVAVGTAIGGYQLGFTLEHGGWAVLTLIPVTVAICCLAIAAFEAVEIDRVGFYEHPSAEDLVQQGSADPMAAVLEREERGRVLSSWTARKKHTALMQARAWFSRGLVALLLAGLVAGASWGARFADRNATDVDAPADNPGASTPSTTSGDPQPATSTPAPTPPSSTSTASTVTGSTVPRP